MEKTNAPRFSVSDFIASANQTLEYAYPGVEVEGEVASFKVNQEKYVFFDLKDAGGSLGCFMTVWQLRMPIEDGMKVIVTAVPKLTNWGKFSLTVRAIRPVGEGSLKKSFELLKAKLDKEGLFAPERKRPLPALPKKVAVISSTQAAGYGDFMKIVDERFGGMQIDVAHVQVQGNGAAEQVIQALRYFNTQEELADVVVIVRGGGSADDLSVFNDEPLVREIAASRIPILTGIGHETDTSLADLAADVRAATPSNAAQLLVPDRRELIAETRGIVQTLVPTVERALGGYHDEMARLLETAQVQTMGRIELFENELIHTERLLMQYNPQTILAKGYAIVRGKVEKGATLEIERIGDIIEAEVRHVKRK